MQDLDYAYLSKIKSQLSSIQKEVKKINKPSPLEELKEKFGGELFKNNNLLKVNRFCSIEYLENENNNFKLTTIIYGNKDEKYYTKDEVIELLLHNT